MWHTRKMTNTYFPNIIGQSEVLNKLSFYIDGFNKTRVFPSILLTGSRGFGKTEIAKCVGRNLYRSDDETHKRLVIISGSEFKGNKALETFVSSVVDAFVVGDQETTLFFDEIHLANDAIKEWLLHVVNPEKGNVSYQRYRDSEYTFDFRKFTFLAATTNPEKLSAPFLSRFDRVDLRPYKNSELIQILKKLSPNVEFKEEVENEIASTMRGNPRHVVQFVTQKLNNYLAQKNSNEFNIEDWSKLVKVLSIRPLGLLTNEIETLKFLNMRKGGASLTEIAAYIQLDRNTVQRNIETFLLHKGLILIDGKRFITSQGVDILNKVATFGDVKPKLLDAPKTIG